MLRKIKTYRYLIVIITFCFFINNAVAFSQSINDGYYKYTPILNKKSVKWQKTPIMFYIPQNDEYYTIIKAAFDTWERKTDKIIDFEETADKSNADILVELVKNLPENNKTNTHILGINNLLSENGNIYQAKIRLVYIDIKSKEKIPEDLMFQTALHEIGHSLGIMHHSCNPDDIMFVPLGKDTNTLSLADINTIKLLYSSEDVLESSEKINDSAFDQKLKIAKKMSKLNPDSAFYYLQISKLYKAHDDYKNAYKYCMKSLKCNPNYSKAKFEKGIIFYKQKKYKKSYNEFYNLVNEYPQNIVYLHGFVYVSYKVNKQDISKKYFEDFKRKYSNKQDIKFINLIEKTIKIKEYNEQ